jgi:alginate O-acetyltransferase complex protein AlgI
MTGDGIWRGRTVLCLMVVFLASGAWHGSQWTFVLWGILHGAGMAVHHLYDQRYRAACRRDRRFVEWRKAPAYAVSSWMLTQGFFLLTLVPFRCGSVGESVDFWRHLLGATGEGKDILVGLGFRDQVDLCLLLLPVGMQFLGTRPADWVSARLQSVPAPVRGVFYGLVLVFLVLFVPVGASTFIYRNF